MRGLFFFFFFLSSLFAEDPFVLTQGLMPTEFELLMQDFSQRKLDIAEKNRIYTSLKKIDQAQQKINKAILWKIIKITIYQNLLKSHQASRLIFLTTQEKSQVQKKLETTLNQYSPFSQWIIQSLIADLEILQKLDYYKVDIILAQKLNEDTLMVQRKLKLISPWIKSFQQLSPNLFSEKLKPTLIQIVTQLAAKLESFLFASHISENLHTSTLFPNLNQFSQPIPQKLILPNKNLQQDSEEREINAQELMKTLTNPKET